MRSSRTRTSGTRWSGTRSPVTLLLCLALLLTGCGGSGQTGAVDAGPGGAGPAEPPPPPTGSRPADDPDGDAAAAAREAATSAGSAISAAARRELERRREQVRQQARREAGERASFTMPRLVGRNLQDAQDRLQARGSYLLDEEDASGAGRLLLRDANWKVCTQRPRAGARVKLTTVVRLAAVKLPEDCP